KEGKKAAQLAATQIAARLASGDRSALDDERSTVVLFQDYAETWLKTHASQLCKFSTARIYEANLKRHVFPLLGSKPLGTISRADCRSLIVACRAKGLSRKSIENIGRTVSSVLSQAVEDGFLQANPAFRLGRYHRTGNDLKPEIHPLTREEASLLLETA